ncbi:DNA-binding protein [Aestuariivirga litoralis]|uniref:DNA-binding protein n=2 Tax=Aestuariivirga litoralis TaxID=2650924 RepID=A0A2W2AM30_9HYPH|nr:DNA-binding protein [Aestuariivirga litoralis]PZF76451.1 DNA-binding protein [Aestuariivirga litoralis]
MDRREAAAYLTGQGFKVSPNTLMKLACIGGGPTFRKFGVRVIYEAPDLDAWAKERLSSPRRSTSQAA